MIIVAGCGYVGASLAGHLHAAGHQVIGLTHSADSAARLAAEHPWPVAACDITSPDSLAQLANSLDPNQTVTAFVHCASSGRGGADAYRSVYLNGLENLIAAFPSAHPLFTSSTSVYAQKDGSTVTESDPATPPRETGLLLRQAEDLALAKGGTVARLAGIYGPGRSFVLKNLLLGKSGVETEDGIGRLINQIHRDDAATALAHLVLQKLPGIFNVCDDAPTTQRDILNPLADLFALPPPGPKPPDPDRKRGWTNKAVSNAKLRASGWTPAYPTYFAALQHDPDLVPSILDLVQEEAPDCLPRSPNIVLIGLMGSGKTTVGKIIARKLGWDFIDTDSLIISQADGRSIPDIFAQEGEISFRQRESAALRSLIGRRNAVIATGGGIVTIPRNLALLRHLGFIVWLEAPVSLLARRTAHNNDRPLLQDTDPHAKLEALLTARSPLYKALSDLRIQTQDLLPEESAYGATESARIFFINQLRLRNSLHSDPT
ncbi:MAG: shikimate kinase [Verrucomicrobiaceae bacterium]|jgi:shikimate kinase/nucleoside-diphosphate-sugar epimerase|nr:shikimate kinase [Verrucomicrobiaceae bacterium]